MERLTSRHAEAIVATEKETTTLSLHPSEFHNVWQVSVSDCCRSVE